MIEDKYGNKWKWATKIIYEDIADKIIDKITDPLHYLFLAKTNNEVIRKTRKMFDMRNIWSNINPLDRNNRQFWDNRN